MTVGSWNPNSASNQQTDTVDSVIDSELLDRFLAIAASDQINHLDTAMSTADKQQSTLMSLPFEKWQETLKTHSDQQLVDLIRFFTLVEVQLSSWIGDSHSPAIAIYALLKKRGGKLEKSQLLWIRENTQNRFIPNGALL